MKKILLFSIPLFFMSSAFGQDLLELKKSFNNYIKMIEDKRLTETVNHIYPKLFDIIPKKTLIKSLEMAESDTTKKLQFHTTKIDKYSKFEIIENITYCFIQYSYKIDTEVDISEDEESLEYMSKEEQIELDLSIWKDKFGKKNVTYNEDNSSIKINACGKVIGIYNTKYGSWKYLDAKKKFKGVYENFLPKKILKNI